MLNNKGVTTVEVLICFVLVTIIATSLFSTVSMFNEKRMEENNKAKILVYNNTLTRIIQKDFINNGLSTAKIEETVESGTRIYRVNCTLKNGEKRLLRVKQKFTRNSIHLEEENIYNDDEFMIEYGTPEKMIKYPIPELGEVVGKYNDDLKTFVPCTKAELATSKTLKNKPSLTAEEAKQVCRVSKNLQINNIIINVSNELTSDDIGSHVLNIYIGLYHPELGNRYAINIVSPIDYPAIATHNNKFDFTFTKG